MPHDNMAAYTTRSDRTDLYRRLKLEQNGLRDEDFAGLGAQVADLGLQQLDLLARPAAPDLEQSVYDGVEVDLVLSHGGGVCGHG